MEWMLTARHIEANTTWEELVARYPQQDLVALVDTWSNALKDSKMSERKTLPTNIAEVLTDTVSKQQRVSTCCVWHTALVSSISSWS